MLSQNIVEESKALLATNPNEDIVICEHIGYPGEVEIVTITAYIERKLGFYNVIARLCPNGAIIVSSKYNN